MLAFAQAQFFVVVPKREDFGEGEVKKKAVICSGIIYLVPSTIPILSLMSKQRSQHVREGADVLLWHEHKLSGKPQQAKIRALQLLGRNPSLTFAEAARQLGCSERTVKRWWKQYRSGGILEVVKEPRTRGRQPRLSEDQLSEIGIKVRGGRLRSLAQTQQWIAQEYGVSYSIKGVSQLLRRIGVATAEKARIERKAAKKQQYPPDQLLTFLNSLSTESDSVAWITAFREGLLQLLADVDKVAVAVNFECDILTPGASGYDVQVQQFVDTAQRASQEVAMNESQQSLTRSQSIIQSLRLRGFTEDLYHQPIAFEYYLKGVEYLGVVVLWREQSKTAIGKETVELLTRLEPFITFALSDLVARHQLAKPQERLFNAAMVAMRNEGQLTEQERRVVILQVTGHTYQQIADRLEISVETVRKHISNVYRKTGTSSSVELFAKYFTPRLSQ